MTNKSPGAPPGKPPTSAPVAPAASAPAPKATNQPITQAKRDYRARWPVWVQQLPYLRLPAAKAQFELVDMNELSKLIQDPEALRKLQTEMNFLEDGLMPYFREHDRKASESQNQYRQYQIGFILLATLATLVGSLQALSLNNGGPMWLWASIEVLIALVATFLATVSGQQSPLSQWLNSRRCAEYLRREYFRYLMSMAPYDTVEGPQKRVLMRQRAADINRGVFPDEVLTRSKDSSSSKDTSNATR